MKETFLNVKLNWTKNSNLKIWKYNLNAILDSQRDVNDKTDLGFTQARRNSDNIVVDTIKLILLYYSNFIIVKIVANEIEKVNTIKIIQEGNKQNCKKNYKRDKNTNKENRLTPMFFQNTIHFWLSKDYRSINIVLYFQINQCKF